MMYQAFKCTGCGAQNAAAAEGECAFCGSPAPENARPKAAVPASVPPPAPPLPMEATVSVDGTGVVCRACGRYASVPGRRMPGNLVLEIVLWCFYLFPGIIYTIWRRQDSSAVKYCVGCNSDDLLPVISTEGQEVFRRKYGRKPSLR
jgi:ribosomal protein L37E